MFFAVNGLKSSKNSPAGHLKPYDLPLMISYLKIEALLVTNSPEGRKKLGGFGAKIARRAKNFTYSEKQKISTGRGHVLFTLIS